MNVQILADAAGGLVWGITRPARRGPRLPRAFESTLFISLALAEHGVFPAASLFRIAVYSVFTQIGLIADFIAAWPTNLWPAHHRIKGEPPDAFE
ncbi:hypothetical protein Nm8I071_38730 [Nonomuraea sp. TT08I-71]|nr:hypothetical protein Nm8I071_38730 [Nonomuraea sp. TT08I-71]